MFPLSRRAFLAIAVVFGGARASAIQAQAVSLDEFVALSARLLGRTKLDPEIAQIYLKALLDDGNSASQLAALTRGGNPTPEQARLSVTIIEWWYTGVYSVGKERRVATHTGALMWSALGRPAPGTCAGPFGAWSRAPRASA